jgi:gliding motility-associated-like protein
MLAISTSFIGFSQAVTNTGKEFWVGYGHHHYMEAQSCGGTDAPNDMNMRIYLSNPSNVVANVTVTIDSSGNTPAVAVTWFKRSYTINPNTVVETENIPKGPVNSVNSFGNTDPNYDARLFTDAPPAGTGGEGKFRGKGIHIVSDVPIVAYAHIYGGVSSGATMLLPIESWGYAYTSVNSQQLGEGINNCYSWTYVIAKEDSTYVEITPSVQTRLGKPAWVPFQVMLMKGQIYQLIGDAVCENSVGSQLTGTKIRSISGGIGDCKPIAVFSGSSRTVGEQDLCGTGSGRDNDMQQCYPQQAWGTRYLTAPFSSGSGSTLRPSQFQTSVYKVAVKDPATTVKKNGVILSNSSVGVSIIASNNGSSICPGTSVKFTAVPTNGGTAPTYQWKNTLGNIPGATGPTYTTTFATSDNISCAIVSNMQCATIKTATSNVIAITVANSTVPAVTVFSTSESTCGSNPIVFKALPTNGGTPSYQWQLDNSNVGNNSDTYILSSVTAGNVVKCTMTSTASCLSTPTATSNAITLNANTSLTPALSIVANVDVTSIICTGTPITFNAIPVNGGATPIYQWKVKDFATGTTTNVGTNSNTFTSSSLAFFDEVTCELTSSATCATAPTTTSNTLTLLVANGQSPSITGYATSTSLCGTGGTVKCFAIPVKNCGTAPLYQWLINNVPATGFTPDSTFTITGLKEGDNIKCTVQSNAGCLSSNLFTFPVTTMITPGLINKSYYIYLSGNADYIEADRAVMVAQFMSQGSNCSGSSGDGDPEMVFLSPIDQGIKKAVFYSTNLQAIHSNFVTIILPTAALPSLRINNSSVFDYTYPITNKPGYSVAIKGWVAEKKQWIVTCDSGFNAITYGLGGAESYAYNAGTNLNNIDGLPAYHNIPDTSALAVMHPYTYVGSPMILRANIAFKPTAMNWKLSYLTCNVISPTCSDVLVNNPIPNDSVIIGNARYYQYSLPTPYTFLVPGTYNLPIELTSPNLDNGNCSNKETVTPEILVKYKPSIDFTYNQNTGCGTDTIRFFADTITPQLYKIIKYKWQFTNNVADTSNLRNPSFYYATPGVYPVKLSIVTLFGGIADTTINVTVTGGTRAHSNFGATPTAVCLGQPIIFSDSTGYFETEYWYWDFGNGYRDTLNNNLPRSYTYTATGTYIVKHSLMGSTFPCIPDTVSRTVIVALAPTVSGVVGQNPTNCLGIPDGAILVNGLLPNTPHILSYVFGGNTITINATSNASGVATIPNLALGTYTNIKAAIGNCSSAPVGPVTLVTPSGPAAPTAGSNTPICSGTTISLVSSPFITGATYAWTGPNGFSSALPNPSISNATTAASGTYSVTVTVSGCTSTQGQTVVAVNAIPIIGSTSSTNPTTCATTTGSITLNGLLFNTIYSVSYTINSSIHTITLTSNGSGTIVIPNLGTGIYSNIIVSLGACTSNPVGPITLTDPNPPATPVASVLVSPICAGGTINLSATSSTNAVTFEWSGPNAYTASGATQAISNATVAATGTYTVVAKLNGCTSAISNAVNVVVNSIPAQPTVGSNTPICAGSTINFTSISTTTGVTYAWTGPNSFISSSQNPIISNATTAATGTYNVTASANGCTSLAGNTVVVVNAIPAISGTGVINPSTCATATGSISLNGLLALTTYTVTYTTSTGAQTTTIISNVSGSVVIANLLAGTYSNIQVVLNNCTSLAVGSITLTDPNPPATPVASSNSPICSGTDLLLSATSATAGVTYSWTGPNGFTSNSQNPTLSAATLAAAGVYSVKATLNGCVSAAGNTPTVVIKETPSISSSNTTNPTSCATATGSITLNGLSANTLYTVSYLKNGSSTIVGISANATGVLIINNLTSGSYTNVVVTLNGCTSSAVGPFILSDPNPPATPVATSNTPLCNGNTLNLSATSTTTGVTFNWTGPNGFVSTLASPSIPNVTAIASGTYNVTATLNSCTSAPFPVTVVVNNTPVISNISSINPPNCSASTGSISLSGLLANTSYAVNYNKNAVGQTATITTNASGVLIIPALTAGNYDNIFVTLGICPSNSMGPITLTDPPPPTTPTIVGSVNLCEGSALNLAASSTSIGATYAWTSTTGFTSTGNAISFASTTLANSGTYTVTATLNNCTSSANAVVTISPYPIVDFTTPSFVCMPNGVTNFVNQSTVVGNGNMTYAWNFGDLSPIVTTKDASHIYASSSSYNITLTATFNGCSAYTSKPFSAFYDKPIASFKIDKDTVCQGVTNTFKDLSTAPNSTIQSWIWDFGDGSSVSTIQNPTKTYSLPGYYPVSLIVKNAQGCTSDVIIKNIKVYLQPKIDAGPSYVLPQGSVVVFSPVTNDTTSVTFSWTPAIDLIHPDSLRPTLVVKNNQVYKITATGLGKCTASDTLTVISLKSLDIPNAFSPNGDKIHDTWEIGNLVDYSFATVEVFTRGGQSVFRSNGYSKPWDGTLNGKPLPIGTYYYIIDFRNVYPIKSGFVVLLR